ncbi:putative membrane protein [Candidatus Ichthyocystis hellenicum]|uniref:Putative membrane protein n=1 Tax=Candidatus Ichthyocystis hellenicum TaxID=1561003 RepID=A0A0S4M367_9BURK|nr:hypothetical protein [Candidatus Ichthyocystis hellenicum]CUT17178.1 putative membrane protein [Candidatus Ichthyocystis hellenicum]
MVKRVEYVPLVEVEAAENNDNTTTTTPANSIEVLKNSGEDIENYLKLGYGPSKHAACVGADGIPKIYTKKGTRPGGRRETRHQRLDVSAPTMTTVRSKKCHTLGNMSCREKCALLILVLIAIAVLFFLLGFIMGSYFKKST